MDQLFSVVTAAEALGVAPHRVAYAVESRGIKNVAFLGKTRIFDATGFDAILRAVADAHHEQRRKQPHRGFMCGDEEATYDAPATPETVRVELLARALEREAEARRRLAREQQIDQEAASDVMDAAWRERCDAERGEYAEALRARAERGRIVATATRRS